MRQAIAGCRPLWPCTSDLATQHSSLRLHHKRIISISVFICKIGNGVIGCAFALILSRRCWVNNSAPLLCFQRTAFRGGNLSPLREVVCWIYNGLTYDVCCAVRDIAQWKGAKIFQTAQQNTFMKGSPIVMKKFASLFAKFS